MARSSSLFVTPAGDSTSTNTTSTATRNGSQFQFVCNTCGRQYKYKHNLHRHKKYECSQEPKFVCIFCPYRAKQKTSLQSHMIYKHSTS
ncbi:hypothetical protein J6590_014874 [Homalodisca vitripennis]|nr:hypothetical protein J6590_014874 [Homalodisca vitripennis]